MKAIFRATALLGSASAINVLIGLVSSKVTAVLLGPSGFGLMSLYFSAISLVVMIAGLGIPTALTRAMAQSLSQSKPQATSGLRRAGWLLTIVAAALAMALVLIFPRSIADVMLDSRSSDDWVVFIVPAILFSMVSSLQLAVINARHQVGYLARISVLTAALSLPPTIALTWWFRSGGVAPALAAGMLINLIVGHVYYRRDNRSVETSPLDRSSLLASATDLIGFGLPYLASLLVGTGVLTVLPILVLHVLGSAEVGMFRASTALAVNYLGVILASLSQDYFPRVAAAPDQADALDRIINDQLRLILLLSGPVIIGMMGAVPYLIPLLYSHRFTAAADILEWQLIGDLFKFTTWTMGFVIMTKLGSRTFFLTELFGGTVLLASSWLGMRIWGLPGLGIAFLVTGALACAVNWLVLYRNRRITWRRDNIVLFLMLALGMALLRVVMVAGLPWLSLMAAAGMAAGFGIYSLLAILREFGGWRALLAKRRGMTGG